MLLALLLLQSVASDTAQASSQVRPPRIEAQVTIDGKLDEPVWLQAARLSGFHQWQPVDGRPSEEETEVLVWYAPNAIHFGIIARDRQPGSIRGTSADRDNLDGEDRVTLYIDPFNDHRRAFFFTVNPLGVQEDGVRTEGNSSAGSLTGGNTDKNPDYRWESKGVITDSGYVVEVRIPFKSMRYPGGKLQDWGLNVYRKVQRTGYEDTWTDVRRASATFLGQGGTMEGLHDLQRGITTEVQPFVTASAPGARTEGGTFEREELEPSFGVNLRLGLTSNVSLDATYNPDFSQVESDASLVTVNERFALFFPEKRPFFLEGIELFSTPNQLVYTRQIVNPIVGGKVSGKFGGLNVAHLSALDEAPGSDAFFTITRLRQDVGSNSTAGLVLTTRDQDGRYNRVAAADARIVFGKLYYVGGQLGGSMTRAVDGGDSRSSPLWEAEFDRTGRSWGFNYKLTGIGEDFEAQSGFVPRNDIVTARAFNRFTIYGNRGAFLETASIFVGPTRIWRYDNAFGGTLEGSESLDLNVTLRGGWKPTAHIERDFVNFEDGDYAGYTVDNGSGLEPYDAPDGVSDGFAFNVGLTTPTFQAMNATARVARNRGAIFPEGSTGYETRLTSSLTVRPTNTIRLIGSTTFSRITRDRDGSEFARTIIPRAQLEYQPLRSLFFRVIGEYVSERRDALEDARTGALLVVSGTPSAASQSNRMRVDLLASFEPSPGTVAFLGYGAGLQEQNAFKFRNLTRQTDGLFVKLAYLIRR
jgi:hypothetical protein